MTAPAAAAPTSLDTGEQFDISDVSEVSKSERRTLRNDAAKVALARNIRAGSNEIYEAGIHENVIWLDRQADLLEDCRFGRQVPDYRCGGWTFVPQACDVRLCPDCERARSARLIDRYDEIGSAMAEPKLWTLTLPNVDRGSLAGGLAVLLDSVAHLRRRSIIAGGPCKGAHRAVAFDDVDRAEHHASGDEVEACAHPPHRKELAAVGSCRCARCVKVAVIRSGQRVTVKGCPRCTHDPVRGGVYSVEMTWSPERQDWHPHAHLLMDAPWISQREMRDAWRAVTCDAIRRHERKAAGATGPLPKCPHLVDAKGVAAHGCRGASIVWVNAVVGAPGSDERRAAIRETLKYVSKGLLDKNGQLLPGAGPLELVELLVAIRGRRLVNGWGSFRNVRDDQADDEPRDTVMVWTTETDRYGDYIPMWLPRLCPCCGEEAEWGQPKRIRRIDSAPWRPPGGTT